MGIQQRLYAQAHCNPSRQKSLDNQYTNMISSFMLPRQTILPRPFHPANSFAPILLQTLEVSCASFREPRPVFSITCRLFCKIPGGGGTSTFPCQASPTPSYAPYASRMDLRDVPRGASIPCGLSRLRILPVTTGVYPSSEVLLLTNPLIFSPSSGNLTGASPYPVRKGC